MLFSRKLNLNEHFNRTHQKIAKNFQSVFFKFFSEINNNYIQKGEINQILEIKMPIVSKEIRISYI